MLSNLLFILLPSLGLLALGIKALTPAGIQLTETRRLSRRSSTIVGIIAILLSLVAAGIGCFVVLRPSIERFFHIT